MDEQIQKKLERLVWLKSQVEQISFERKARQEEILSSDEKLQSLKKIEDDFSSEYEQLRAEVSELGKKMDLNGKHITENGSVSFSYTKSYSIKDE